MKNLIAITGFLCLLFSNFNSYSQYDISKINKKAVEAYNTGLERAQDARYSEAITYLKDAIQKDSKYIDAYLSLAGVFGQIKDHQQSVLNYEQAFALDADYTWGYRLPYSINLAGLGQFDKALDAINTLLTRERINPNTRKAAEFRKKSFEFAIDYEKNKLNNSYVFAPQNLGDEINSAFSEYFPTIPIENDKLIFTRKLNNTNEDFFGSIKIDGKWQKANSLPGNINTPLNEGAQNISQDGEWLIFTGCHRPKGMGGCDLYISYLTENGWSEAVNLGSNINSEHWDSQPSLSPDKKELYFASNRPGGFGGSDIYVSRMQPNGRWGKPENLGADINTSGEETSPFIHADNQTLYFASNGLPGYGEEDLFITRRGPDNKWSKPENLGYPINTIHNEATIFIAADGKTAYYASDRSDSRGGLDIYSFQLREDIQPFKTLWVKGQVYDIKTKAGIPSSVELIDIFTKQVISKVQTDETGNYLITLPVGKDYAFNVNRKGYLFYSDNYFLKSESPDSTYRKDIPLQPIEVNAAVVLKNIFFDVNKFDLKNESQAELDKIVQLLLENNTLKIQIEGHTDDVGKDQDNLKLSENRAKAVIAYLVENGISQARLTAKGFGETKPIADNNTEQGKAKNRRTELKVIAK
jgi:outer membrane protein OmpA-like peptidoglycan-associated protein/Tol biopolymer transport system component